MKIQVHTSSDDGKLFNISFCSNDSIFEIIELSEDEIDELRDDIEAQVNLLKVAYEDGILKGEE